MASTSPPLVLNTPPPVPNSYICSNVTYPTYHGYSSDQGWSFPADSSGDKTVLCSPQTKTCKGHYELTTWYPLYPQTAPNNPLANSGSPGQNILSYVDLRCVDTPTPKDQRFEIVDGPLPLPAGELPLSGATDKEVCEKFVKSPTMATWVNKENTYGQKPGPYAGLTMWNSIQSGVPLIMCQVNTKPSETASNLGSCISGITAMPPASPPSPASVTSPPLDSFKPPFQVTCNAIPYDYEFNIVKSTLSDIPEANKVTNQTASNWETVVTVKAGEVQQTTGKNSDINTSWDCSPDTRTTFNGIGNETGTTYTCTGYTDDPSGLFMVKAAEKISCDNPDFAKCVSSLFNNFQQTFIPPSDIPDTYSGTCSDVDASVDCSQFTTTDSCNANNACTASGSCSQPGWLFEDLCVKNKNTWNVTCSNKGICDDQKTTCKVDYDCPGSSRHAGKPDPQMGDTGCTMMPDFVQKEGDENVWVPSAWPTMASPLPQVLESNHNGCKCGSSPILSAGQDLATLVQYMCSSTQLGKNGQLMKYVTVYDEDMTDIINQALYANTNSGCLQHCGKDGKCSKDGQSCTLDTDCMDSFVDVFVPEQQAGTCSSGSCGRGPMKNYPCSKDADCAGSDQVDVRITGKVFQDRCTSGGGTWQWYEDQPPPAVKDAKDFQGSGIDPAKLVSMLPQENLTWKSSTGTSGLEKNLGQTVSKAALAPTGTCNMYVLEQQGQATPGCYAQGSCEVSESCTWKDSLIEGNSCSETVKCDTAPQYLEGVMFPPPINTQGAACPPFCDLESSLMTIGTIAAGASALAVPGVGGLVAGALIAGGAIGGGVVGSKISAAMNADNNPDDPVADPVPPIDTICSDQLSAPMCITGPKAVPHQ